MKFDIDVSSIFRTVAVLAMTVPFTFSLADALSANAQLSRQKLQESKVQEVYKELQGQMVLPCIKYRVSKADTKLEREAKNDLDEIFGGDVAHGPACNFVLNTRR